VRAFGVSLLGLLVLALPAAPAAAGRHFLDRGDVAVAVLGGVDVPIAQEDASWGPVFGARARMGIFPTLAAEAVFEWVEPGDGTTVSGGALPAPSLRHLAFGVVARSGRRGLGLAFSTGLGWSRFGFPGGLGSRSGLSWYAAPALEMPLGPVRIDAGPRFLVSQQDGRGTRKHLGAQIGLSYGF